MTSDDPQELQDRFLQYYGDLSNYDKMRMLKKLLAIENSFVGLIETDGELNWAFRTISGIFKKLEIPDDLESQLEEINKDRVKHMKKMWDQSINDKYCQKYLF